LPGESDLCGENCGHDQGKVEELHQSLFSEVSTHVTPDRWILSGKALQVVGHNHDLLAKAAQRKQNTGQGMPSANDPSSVTLPESILRCVRVFISIRPRMVKAVEPNPEHR
jgi:hypothetical protein